MSFGVHRIWKIQNIVTNKNANTSGCCITQYMSVFPINRSRDRNVNNLNTEYRPRKQGSYLNINNNSMEAALSQVMHVYVSVNVLAYHLFLRWSCMRAFAASGDFARTEDWWHQKHEMFPMETSSVAPGNSRVLTVKLGRETSLVANSTDKRSTCSLYCSSQFSVQNHSLINTKRTCKAFVVDRLLARNWMLAVQGACFL